MREKNVFGKSAVILAALCAGAVLSGCTDGSSEVSADSSGSVSTAASGVSSVSGGAYGAGSQPAAISSTQSSSSQPAAVSSTQSASSQPAPISSTQSASSQSAPVAVDPASYITEDEAREIALNEWNVREYQVEFTRSELGYDKGTAVYYIEYDANTFSYKFKVNAADGTVKNNGVDIITNAPRTPESVLISEDAALEAALKQQKYSENEVEDITVELYYEGSRAMYEVKFVADNFIWGTHMDAVTAVSDSVSKQPLM